MTVASKLLLLLYSLVCRLICKLVKFKTYRTSYYNLRSLIIEQIGCSFRLLDEKYYYTDISGWRKIISSDPINVVKKWKKDRFDCDNFATTFSSHVAEFFGLNTAGIAIGYVYDSNTLELLGRHAYNILLVRNGDKDELWLYEPQTDEMVKAEKRVKLGDWIYETTYVVFG